MLKLPLNLKSVYARILMFNIFLVIITSLIPQIVFSNYFTITFNNEIRRQSTQNVRKLQYSVDETILNRMVNFTKDYFSDYASNLSLTYPLTHDISYDTIKISEVSNTLSDITNKQNYIDSIEVLYTNENIYFEDSNVTMLKLESSVKGLDEPWIRELKEPKSSIHWISSRKLNWKNGHEVITCITSIPFFADTNSRQAIVAINLKKEALYNLIKDTKPQDGEELLIIDEMGYNITQSSQSLLGKDITQQDFIKRILSSDTDVTFDASINGKRCVVSQSKSSYNGWRYVSIISTDSLFKKSNQLKNYLIFISILMLIVNLIISIIFTKKVNKPLISIVKKILNIGRDYINNSRENENEYMLLNSTINNVTEKITYLSAQIEENKPIIRDKIIMRLLKGKINENLDTIQYEQFLDMDFNYSKIKCCVLKIFSTPDIGLEDELIIKYSCINLLEMNECCNICASIDENGNIAAIINYDGELFCEEILNKICEHIKCKFVLGFGTEYKNSLQVVSESYTEACECLKYAYIKPGQKLIKYEDLSIEKLKRCGSTPRILEKLSISIKNYNKESIYLALESIIEGIIVGGYKIQYCINTLFDAVSTIRTACIDMGCNLDTVLGYDIREYFKKVEDIEEFREWINTVVDNVITFKEEQTSAPGSELKEKIGTYIEDNIYNDISLTTLSEGINMNPSYVSRIFKSVIGMNFTEYTLEVKMLHAERMLKKQEYSIQEISDKLGYTSSRYFTKIFKERHGCTPKEYQSIKNI